MSKNQKSDAIISLARDILRKIKKNDVKLSNILLQAAELSHLIGINENITFFEEGSEKVEKSQVYLDAFESNIKSTQDPSFSISSANQTEILGWNIPKGNHFEREKLRLQQQNAIQTVARYKSQTYDFVMKVYYAHLFGVEAMSLIDHYKEISTAEIIKKFPDLKTSFEVINQNMNGTNPREWAATALECRNILIKLSEKLWKKNSQEYVCKDGDKIKTENEKNKLIAYVDTKTASSPLDRARRKRHFGTIHEIFAIGGKAKRAIDNDELSTVVILTFTFLADLITYTDMNPIE